MSNSNSSAPVFKNRRTTLERIEKFISVHHFTDCNLYGKLYGQSVTLNSIEHVNCAMEKPNFQAAKQMFKSKGSSVSVGHSLGPTWSTHWFRITFAIPKEWQNATVHLLWDSSGEAMLYDSDGNCLQVVYKKTNQDFGEKVLYVESACNGLFGAGKNGQINPPELNKTFELKTAKLSIHNESVYSVFRDLELIYDLAKDLPQARPSANQALYTGNDIVNLLCSDPTNEKSLRKAHQIATQFFKNRSDSEVDDEKPCTKKAKLGQSALLTNGEFRLYAIGNCHIDTAWLWPYSETRRKCARSWQNTIALMKQYPNITFAVSQAQQLVWLREDHPKMFTQIQELVKKNRFLIVGGCWVEMDGNLPSGESFIRQLLYGQQFFNEAFGSFCEEFWLPDTFGYSAQLPQIMNLAGITRFVTQKISWNLVNKFPHNTFYWKGIDGSCVLTHFPPGGNYSREVTINDCIEQVRESTDHGRCNRAMMLYGHGDGGGGITRDMCERLNRLEMSDSQTLGLDTTVISSTSKQFFEHVEEHDSSRLSSWVGELYLELHQGTFTSQASVKHRNRQLEYLLRDCEFLAAMVFVYTKGNKVRMFDVEWKKLLLNQFHDVLPGSSIAQVYEDAHRLYDQIETSCQQAIKAMCADFGMAPLVGSPHRYVLNSECFARNHYSSLAQMAPVRISEMSLTDLKLDLSEATRVFVRDEKDLQGKTQFIIKNQYLRAVLNPCGQIVSLMTAVSSRDRYDDELIDENSSANQFNLYHDVPLYWDAWDIMDYHVETKHTIDNIITPLTMEVSQDNYVKLSVSLRISATSTLKQSIILRSDLPYIQFETFVDWNESHRLLKWTQNTNLQSEQAQYDIQFGYLNRPTHRNTSWEAAKYEVCGHRYALLAEQNRGLAMLNTDKYGHSCFGSSLSLSLLRAAKAPDAHADLGNHLINTALMPFRGSFANCGSLNVTETAAEFNHPLLVLPSAVPSMQFATIIHSNPEHRSIALETVKIAESKNGLVLRFVETLGGSGKATIRLHVASYFGRAPTFDICNGLERKIEEPQCLIQNAELPYEFTLSLKKFQILSVFVH